MAAETGIVAGYCPMGCGRTLFLGEGGTITCSYLRCPDRLAVDRILADAESEHIVEFERSTFTIRHPLRERIDDELLRCALHEYVAGLDGPPVRPGRYRAVREGEQWIWRAAPDPATTED